MGDYGLEQNPRQGFLGHPCNTPKNGDPGTTASPNQNSPGQEAPGFTEQRGVAVKAIDDHSTWAPA